MGLVPSKRPLQRAAAAEAPFSEAGQTLPAGHRRASSSLPAFGTSLAGDACGSGGRARRAAPRGVTRGARIATARAGETMRAHRPSLPTAPSPGRGGRKKRRETFKKKKRQITPHRHLRAWKVFFSLFWLSARWQQRSQTRTASNGLVEKTVLSRLRNPQRAMQLRNSRYWLFSWKLQSPLLLAFPPAGLTNLQKYISALYAAALKANALGLEKNRLTIVGLMWIITS